MSVSATQPTPASTASPSRAGRRSTGWIARVVVVCLLIVASGIVRQLQAERVRAYMSSGRVTSFKLESIPKEFGSWTGQTVALDPEIVKGTGSDDLITRRYTDQRTGVSLDVIVLYGPTTDIFIHSPELCYPKAGYGLAGEPLERPIATPAGNVPFRAVVYNRGEPGRREIQEVYYTWRYNNHWATAVESLKRSERIPGMYKVQIARPASPNEARTVNNPCEEFLEKLIPDLEARITGQSPPSPEATQPKL